MKKAIHPTYYPEAEVVCACGNTFKVGSTTEKIDIELCSKCHPFYTGKQKLVDTARRVEKFHEKISRKDTGAVAAKKTKKAERVVTKKAKKDAK